MPFSTLIDSLLEGNENFSAVISNAPARVGFEASTAIVVIEERGECSHADIQICARVVKGDYVSQCTCTFYLKEVYPSPWQGGARRG